MQNLTIRNLLSSLLLAALAAAAAAADLTPNQVVEQTVNNIARKLDGHKSELSANKKELYALIDHELLPQFDTDYAGRLVLGKAWRDATPEQRKRFVDAFYKFLLHSYATSILKFEQNNIRVLPARKPPEEDKTTVETEMSMADGSKVPVNYAMHATPAGWKAYDVRIEGVSYVQNYRNQFNAEVAAKGLEALIKRLEHDAAEADSGRKEPDRPSAVAPPPTRGSDNS